MADKYGYRVVLEDRNADDGCGVVDVVKYASDIEEAVTLARDEEFDGYDDSATFRVTLVEEIGEVVIKEQLLTWAVTPSQRTKPGRKY